MNKLTKGAIATAAGVILLMGGAGTLASWNSSANLGASQAITAGSLSVTPSGTVTPTWKSGATVINPSTFKVVPGDTLTYSQTFNVAATGDNLLFTVAATAGTFGTTAAGADTALATVLTKSASYTVTGTGIAASTTPGTYKVGTGTSTIVVTMTITFPYGTGVDNSAQTGSVTLGTGAVTLTQTQTP